MKGKIFVLFLLLFALFMTPGCADNRPKYKNLAFEFLIHYPPAWEVKEGVGSAVVAFLRPRLSKEDFFQETLTVTVDDLTQPTTLAEYTQAITAQIKAIGTVKDVVLDIGESSETRIGGNPAHQLVYTLTQYGLPPELVKENILSPLDDKGTTLKMMLVWTIKGDRAYLFTFVALRDNYETYVKDVDAMIQSFRFL